MIFLSAPYSSPFPEIRQKRLALFCEADRQLMERGVHSISPLLKTWVAEGTDQSTTWAYWKNYAEKLIVMSKEVIVLMVDGWDISEGVRDEVEYAISHNIPVSFMKFNEDGQLIEAEYPSR